jgi:phenylacetate-CoA ligase
MIILRGVNLFPTQIEELVLGVPELTPHFQCVRGRSGNMDTLTVRIERHAHVSVEAGEAAGRHVAELVKHRIGVSVGVEVVEPFAIERSVGKMRRIVDQRPAT